MFIHTLQIKIGNVLGRLRFEKSTYDIYLISFQKSGRTWIRFFLTTYISRKYYIPFHLDVLSNVLLPSAIPSISFSHFNNYSYTGNKLKKYIETQIASLTPQSTCIFLYRDPRDVVVSYYFQMTKRENTEKPEVKLTKNMTLSEFIRSEDVGLPRIITYMNAVYGALQEREHVQYVSYEDCKSNTDIAFKMLLTTIGESIIDGEMFDSAISASSFQNMKSVERSNIVSSRRLSPGDINDPESYKVRKGKVGGYQEYFSEDDFVYAGQQLELLNSFFDYK